MAQRCNRQPLFHQILRLRKLPVVKVHVAPGGRDFCVPKWKLTREFLELHNTAQLAKLVEEWNHAGGLNLLARGVAKRGELIESIMQLPDAVKCPRELLELKPVRLI